MFLYAIGVARGSAFTLGLSKDAKAEAAKLQKGSPDELVVIVARNIAPGWDELALSLATRELAGQRTKAGWYHGTASDMTIAIDRACRAVRSSPAKEPSDLDFSDSVRAIRAEVFGDCSQEVLGAIAGRAASHVCRWEAGSMEPSLADLARLREFARANGLPWRDEIVFDNAKKVRAKHDSKTDKRERVGAAAQG